VAERGAQPEHTPDGHHVVVDGRRWRATDPEIPPPLAAQLRHELMDARRAVAVARRQRDDVAESDARRRVHAAKVALGERGHPWWEAPDRDGDEERIAAAVAALVASRPAGTVCPSEAARVAGGQRWRALMPVTRQVVESLADRGDVVVTQRGQRVAPPWRGPIRIGAPAAAPGPDDAAAGPGGDGGDGRPSVGRPDTGAIG
jgi:hypothetical protein